MNKLYIVKRFKMLIKKLSSKKIVSIVNKICLKFELSTPSLSLLPSLLPVMLKSLGTAGALPTQVGWTKSGAGAALKTFTPSAAF